MVDDLESLRRADGGEEWREQKSKELGDLVQRRFENIQVCPGDFSFHSLIDYCVAHLMAKGTNNSEDQTSNLDMSI